MEIGGFSLKEIGVIAVIALVVMWGVNQIAPVKKFVEGA